MHTSEYLLKKIFKNIQIKEKVYLNNINATIKDHRLIENQKLFPRTWLEIACVCDHI